MEGAKQQQHRVSASPRLGSEYPSRLEKGSCGITQDEVLRREASGLSGSHSMFVYMECCWLFGCRETYLQLLCCAGLIILNL